jgi:hypothetical protein
VPVSSSKSRPSTPAGARSSSRGRSRFSNSASAGTPHSHDNHSSHHIHVNIPMNPNSPAANTRSHDRQNKQMYDSSSGILLTDHSFSGHSDRIEAAGSGRTYLSEQILQAVRYDVHSDIDMNNGVDMLAMTSTEFSDKGRKDTAVDVPTASILEDIWRQKKSRVTLWINMGLVLVCIACCVPYFKGVTTRTYDGRETDVFQPAASSPHIQHVKVKYDIDNCIIGRGHDTTHCHLKLQEINIDGDLLGGGSHRVDVLTDVNSHSRGVNPERQQQAASYDSRGAQIHQDLSSLTDNKILFGGLGDNGGDLRNDSTHVSSAVEFGLESPPETVAAAAAGNIYGELDSASPPAQAIVFSDQTEIKILVPGGTVSTFSRLLQAKIEVAALSSSSPNPATTLNDLSVQDFSHDD